MPHRIDAAKIADAKAGKDNIKLAKARLDEIATLPATATTAQLRAAIKDLAAAVRHIIRALPVLLLLSSVCFAGSVAIQWDANNPIEGVNEYRVYRNGQRIARTSGTAISFANVSSGRPYRYQVTAVNSTAESGFSNPADIIMPSVPANAKVIITWEVK